MPEINNSSSSTKEAEAEAEAIMICVDTSSWMENTKSPMFKDQAAAVQFYYDKKIKSHPRTIVGVCGTAKFSFYHLLIRPTRDLPMIIDIIDDGHIGGVLELLYATEISHSHFFHSVGPDMKKRIVYFAGGPLFATLDKAKRLGIALKEMNVACDVISFGVSYLDKRQFFNTLEYFANIGGNCNICHVPPESSVFKALSRSEIFIPRFGGNCNICHVPPESSVFKALSRSEIFIPRFGVGTSSAHSVQHDKNMPIVIYVKPPPSDPGFPADDLKTDCPFCQRVLLTLEEKEVSYKIQFMRKKPKWFFEKNPVGILPLIRFSDGTLVSNSDVIVQMIEEMYPEHPLENPPEFSYVGLKILPKLAAFLKRKDKNDGSEQALLRELGELERLLLQHGPYVIGKEITAVDLSLAPKLYHLLNACGKFTVPGHLTNVLRYKELLFNYPSFKKTKPSQKDVKEGWRRKVNDARG